MFNRIDFNSWPRAQVFYYFAKMAPTGYSITTDIDVTKVKQVTREKGLRFFPAYLWLVTRNLNRQMEFKCAEKDGVTGYYDTLTPLYASWHDDTKTFSLMWTEYDGDFMIFHERYLENQRRYGDVHGVLCQPGTPPENAYTVSALPWVEFTHFAVHSYENRPYYLPSVEAGRYRSEGGRLIMPLSLTCHHATTDGYHVSEFIKALNADIARFDDFVK